MKNSLLLRSAILELKCLDKDPPNTIRLNMNIVYAADNTIEEQANAPRSGSLSKVPYKLINSPTKFRVKGVPALPKQRIKNITEKTGIIWAIPL